MFSFPAFIIGIILILIVLWDAFETVVLPRRVTRRYRLVRLFYRVTWPLWSGAVRTLLPASKHENFLSYYGPLSMLVLLGLWAFALIIGFALLFWAQPQALAADGAINFGICLYFSGTNFFTLGIGDIAPLTPLARALSPLEAGMGFAFLALVISYLPAINQAFSRREVSVSLLDARAGSPPTTIEILRRHVLDDRLELLDQLLLEWEQWSAELLESHLSFPMLVYFRSQHEKQSWLAAITSILDTSSLIMAVLPEKAARQAGLTFAAARRTVVDLSLVLHADPMDLETSRLGPTELKLIRSQLSQRGIEANGSKEADNRLSELRHMYEPYAHSLSRRLLLPLPPWAPDAASDERKL